ncbi:MAG: aldehyde dehydrogenase family protein, partial [Chloroflexi bacterium]
MVTVDSPGRLLIGGSWRGGQDEETFEIIEPATSQVMATAAVASPADVDAAVSAARAAFESGAW